MPVRELGSRKNHILILSDEVEEQHTIDGVAKSDRVIKEYLVALMASMMRRGVDATRG